jgi:hypothetical protein
MTRGVSGPPSHAGVKLSIMFSGGPPRPKFCTAAMTWIRAAYKRFKNGTKGSAFFVSVANLPVLKSLRRAA